MGGNILIGSQKYEKELFPHFYPGILKELYRQVTLVDSSSPRMRLYLHIDGTTRVANIMITYYKLVSVPKMNEERYFLNMP